MRYVDGWEGARMARSEVGGLVWLFDLKYSSGVWLCNVAGCDVCVSGVAR